MAYKLLTIKQEKDKNLLLDFCVKCQHQYFLTITEHECYAHYPVFLDLPLL